MLPQRDRFARSFRVGWDVGSAPARRRRTTIGRLGSEPMRQISGRALWIGHVGDTRHPRPLLDAGIAAVIELADSEPLATLPRELVRCRFPLTDGGGNPPWLVRLAVEAVAGLLRAGVPTLVCCGSGMSRSVSIAAGGLAPLRTEIAERGAGSDYGGGASRCVAGIAWRSADSTGRWLNGIKRVTRAQRSLPPRCRHPGTVTPGRAAGRAAPMRAAASPAPAFPRRRSGGRARLPRR